MTELEQTLLPQMDEYMTPWMHYVDDTVAAIHPDHVKDALKTLNSFNKTIQFTCYFRAVDLYDSQRRKALAKEGVSTGDNLVNSSSLSQIDINRQKQILKN